MMLEERVGERGGLEGIEASLSMRCFFAVRSPVTSSLEKL